MMKRLLAAIFLTVLTGGITIAQPAVPIDTWITLERTPCYGACPWYKLSISADGEVKFISKSLDANHKEVDNPPIKGKIDVDKVKYLISAFESVKYLSLSSRYDAESKGHCPSYFTDMPSAITSITMRGKRKEIYHYLGCAGSPVLDKLTALEKEIDAIVNIEQYLKQRQKQ